VRRVVCLVLTRLFVQWLECHVVPVGSGDGAKLRLDANLDEKALVGERLSHTLPHAPIQRYVAHDPVLKGEA
jgi:hypothetical protein